MAAKNPLTKISRQHEVTWTQLQKRTSDVAYSFGQLFPDDVETFLHQKASSINSSIGYIVPALLSTTAFLSAKNGCRVATVTHEQPMNLYTIFVGYPGTGKSSAIQHGCLGPLASLLDNKFRDFILDRPTSSGLVKHISSKKAAFIVSPEVYDVLNKLLKNDEDSASGDVTLLCKLFSGETCSYTYATEHDRNIPANTPFSILGCTQMPNAAKLVARMDQGQGLIDRFLLAVPNALCPTSDEVENARQQLTTEPDDLLHQVFYYINDCQQNQQDAYEFNEEAKEFLKNKKDAFIAEVNGAIQDGSVIPPKSKHMDLVPRLAAALHVFTTAFINVSSGHDEDPIPTLIDLSTLTRAESYVAYLETQKNMICQFIKSIVHDVCDAPRRQPTCADVKTGILQFPGPVVTYRSFHQSAQRFVRRSTKQEYDDAIEQLKPHLGSTVSIRVARSSQPTQVFLKKKPANCAPWSHSLLCEFPTYDEKYHMPIHKSITKRIKDFLLEQQFITPEQYRR